MAAKTSGDDLMLFCVQVVGQGHVGQHDRFAELAAGSGVLIEARSACELLSSSESRSLTLRFPRELLPLRTAEITEGCARSMDPAAPAMQMLSGYLDRLFDLADDLTASQRLDAGQAAIDLLAMVLRDVTPVRTGRGRPRGCLLDMMRTHVRDTPGRPGAAGRGTGAPAPRVGPPCVRPVRTDRDDAWCVPSRAAAARGPGDAVRPEIRPARDVGHRGCRRVPRPQDVRAGVPAAVRDDAGRLAA